MNDKGRGELHESAGRSEPTGRREAAGQTGERLNEPATAGQADEVERELADMLAGEPESEPEPAREARLRSRLSPKYEIRIQTTHDPIVAETERYRELAEEIDDRYDRYMDRARRRDDE